MRATVVPMVLLAILSATTVARGGTTACLQEEAMADRQSITYSLGEAPANPQRAKLRLEQVRHSNQSFEVRVFVNQPDADAETSTRDNEHYAGSFFQYGHGVEVAGPQEEAPPGALRLERFDAQVDLTEALRKLRASGETAEKITLVVVGADGEPLDPKTLDLEGVRIETR